MTSEGKRAHRYDAVYPDGFVAGGLGWLPWLDPMTTEEMTPRHWHGIVYPHRATDSYFLTQVRAPELLRARTFIEVDALHVESEGRLPRADREVAATAVARFDGSVLAAAVHAQQAAIHSERPEDIDRLLEEGVDADLGERWNAIVEAVTALAATPIAFNEKHVERLHAAGLNDLEIADMLQTACFISWADRIVDTLGRPALPDVDEPWV